MLWSQPQETSSSEIPDAQPDPQLMEEYHGIKPKVATQKFVNPWKFNTLKAMTIKCLNLFASCNQPLIFVVTV